LVWLEAARPRTLPAAAAPVVLGAAISVALAKQHAFGVDVWALVLSLLGALLIQVGTNYANDYFDFVKGADTDERKGPRRATQAGLVAPGAMRAAFVLTFALAVLVGLALVVRLELRAPGMHAGLPIVAVGLLSVVFGVLYTGGPRPLGYLGLGDALVLVFFGPVAVAGTVWAGTSLWSLQAAIAGLVPGLLSCAILAVNNLRDVDTDAKAQKRTLAVRFGPAFARAEYASCVVLALLLPALFAGLERELALALPVLAAPIAIRRLRAVRVTSGAALNPLLGQTAQLLLIVCLLFAVGWWLVER
jgi:1,4-dihydroxy-2-naphthoate octaprenyltransferase